MLGGAGRRGLGDSGRSGNAARLLKSDPDLSKYNQNSALESGVFFAKIAREMYFVSSKSFFIHFQLVSEINHKIHVFYFC